MLSYYWGKGLPANLKTTESNLTEWMKRVSWEDLPVLFYDAIILTRQLGYQYLWIDTLCIIQDSTADWELQSAQMGYIYKESALTIAAEASEDCTVGIFESTDISKEESFLEISTHSSKHGTQGVLYLGRNLVENSAARKGPLSRRA
jgi:hypothetical protein